MAYQAVRITPETDPGVFDDTAVGTLLRVSRSNMFPGRPTPLLHHIRDAAGSNRIVHTRYGQFSSTGKFGSFLYYGAQSKVILPWACNLTGSPLKLGTVTIDHILQMDDDDGTLKYCRYPGAKCQNLRLTGNNNGEGILLYIECDFISQEFDDTIDVTDFPMPALTDYPTGKEGIFEELDGGLTIGTVQAHIKSLNLNIKNILRAQYDAKPWPARIRWAGRDIDFSAKLLYDSTQMRDDFNAVASKTCAIVLTDGTNTITLNLRASNVISSVEDDLPLDDEASETVNITNRLDVSAATDLTLTIAP